LRFLDLAWFYRLPYVSNFRPRKLHLRGKKCWISPVCGKETSGHQDVSVVHLDGYASSARGTEIFHGSYQNLRIIGALGNLVIVEDPDHITFEKSGQKFARVTDPPSGNPVCEPGNRFHVKARFAVSRGFHLNDAKQYEQSNCWYMIATNLGDHAGVQGIAYAYWMGEGVPKDPVKAFKLDTIAAEQGQYVRSRRPSKCLSCRQRRAEGHGEG
jgi:hypothetical protein